MPTVKTCKKKGFVLVMAGFDRRNKTNVFWKCSRHRYHLETMCSVSVYMEWKATFENGSIAFHNLFLFLNSLLDYCVPFLDLSSPSYMTITQVVDCKYRCACAKYVHVQWASCIRLCSVNGNCFPKCNKNASLGEKYLHRTIKNANKNTLV